MKIPENAFQYIHKLTIFVICETSKDNTIFLRYESYPSKTSFSKSDNNLVLRMRRVSLVLFCSLSCAFVAQ